MCRRHHRSQIYRDWIRYLNQGQQQQHSSIRKSHRYLYIYKRCNALPCSPLSLTLNLVFFLLFQQQMQFVSQPYATTNDTVTFTQNVPPSLQTYSTYPQVQQQVTTPISLPGMPPITVSATIPPHQFYMNESPNVVAPPTSLQ